MKSLLCYAGRDGATKESPLWASLNVTGMTQVFSNLLRNALQSSDSGTRVDLATRVVGDRVQIEVSDRGCGMSSEDVASIFDPFFMTKRASSGTGLGLALADALVTDHGGSIQVESEQGVGSRFVIELPAYPSSSA